MYFKISGKDEREKYQYNYNTVLSYLELKCRGKSVRDFFVSNQFNNIAIYGLDDLGKCFVEDLINSDVKIEYIIDHQKSINIYKGIQVSSIESISSLNDVDVIVITDLFNLNKIIDLLLQHGVELEKIININDIVYSF